MTMDDYKSTRIGTKAILISCAILAPVLFFWQQIATTVYLLLPKSSNTTAMKIEKLSLPEIRGRILDSVTGLPIARALVFGAYTVQHQPEGNVSGHGIGGEKHDLFRIEVETDGNGDFRIPSTDPVEISVPTGNSVRQYAFTVFKDGYRESGFASETVNPLPSSAFILMTPEGGTISADRSALKLRLIPTKTENERLQTYLNARNGAMSSAPCGWEQYGKTHWAFHLAWKDWLHRNVPSGDIASDGYPSRNYAPSGDVLRVQAFQRTFVDALIDERIKSSDWKCRDPRDLFQYRK